MSTKKFHYEAEPIPTKSYRDYMKEAYSRGEKTYGFYLSHCGRDKIMPFDYGFTLENNSKR